MINRDIKDAFNSGAVWALGSFCASMAYNKELPVSIIVGGAVGTAIGLRTYFCGPK